MAYTEEVETYVGITHEGHKEIKKVIVVYKDGIEHSRSKPHREVIHAEADVPQEITDFIQAKRVKQPKKIKLG